MVDNGIGDASFVLSMALAGAFLKPKETKSQTEILVTPKEEIVEKQNPASIEIAGLAITIAILGTAFSFSRFIAKHFGDHHGWGVRKSSVEPEKHSKQEKDEHSKN